MLDDLLIIAVAFFCGSGGLYAVTASEGALGVALSLIGLVALLGLRLTWFFEDTVGAYPHYSFADLYPVLGRWLSEAADG